MGPIGPMSVRRLYRRTRAPLREEFRTSWDAVERIAPTAVVAWDARGQDVSIIDVIADRWPAVRDDRFAWWVWEGESAGSLEDGDWVPWNVTAAHPIVVGLVGDWGRVTPVENGSFFNVLPPDFRLPQSGEWWEPDWALQLMNDVHGVQYSRLDQWADGGGSWGAYRSFDPQHVEEIVESTKDIALNAALQRSRGRQIGEGRGGSAEPDGMTDAPPEPSETFVHAGQTFAVWDNNMYYELLVLDGGTWREADDMLPLMQGGPGYDAPLARKYQAGCDRLSTRGVGRADF